MNTRPLSVYFYANNSGHEPVRNWLKELDLHDKKIIGEDIKTMQYGWPLGMPLVRNLGDGLWEVRSQLASSRIARIIFFMRQNRIVLLHGFIKKTQKTPPDEIKLAQKRKKEVMNYE